MHSAKHFFNFSEFKNYETHYYFNLNTGKSRAHFFPTHVDDHLEIYVLLEGESSFLIESSLYKLTAGDAVVIKPNEIHNCILEKDSVHKHMCFWFDCSNSFIFNDFLCHEFGENNLVSPPKEEKARLIELATLMKEATDNKDKHKFLYLSLEMLDIFRKNIVKKAPSKEYPELLKNIIKDIDQNFKEIKALNYFTDKYFISQSTLNRLFKTYLHTSPKFYLETKRLAYSRRLLKEGASVLYACMESGFTDYSNYIRLFKSRFYMTPKKYRDS